MYACESSENFDKGNIGGPKGASRGHGAVGESGLEFDPQGWVFESQTRQIKVVKTRSDSSTGITGLNRQYLKYGFYSLILLHAHRGV